MTSRIVSRHWLMFKFVAAVVLTYTVANALERQSYSIRKEDSAVSFTITKWLVIKEEGRFKDYEGTIQFDEGDPSATRVNFRIYTGSIDSRDTDRDQVIRSEEYLNVKRFPTMAFVGVAARAGGKDTILVEGDFTIRDVSKRITVPVLVLGVHRFGNPVQEIVGFETSFTINRLEYGVGPKWKVLGDDVTIHLMIGAGRMLETARR